jgi:hypothetical protein
MLIVHLFRYIKDGNVLFDKITKLLFRMVFPNCSSVETFQICEDGFSALIMAFVLEKDAKSILENMSEFS